MYKKRRSACLHAKRHPARTACLHLIPPTSFNRAPAPFNDRPALHYVYIVANVRRNFQVGSTDDLADFVARHNVTRFSKVTERPMGRRLVYVEFLRSEAEAAARKEQLERMGHTGKTRLIEKENPRWEDLADWEIPTLSEELRFKASHCDSAPSPRKPQRRRA